MQGKFKSCDESCLTFRFLYGTIQAPSFRATRKGSCMSSAPPFVIGDELFTLMHRDSANAIVRRFILEVMLAGWSGFRDQVREF